MDPSILKNLECPICMEYFQKPIQQCSTGHSFCSSCKAKLDKCPFCMQKFSNTRNYIMENLINTVKVPCKNENCTKVIPLHNYVLHANEYCQFRTICCKYPSCSWKDNKLLVNDHIRSAHPSLIVHKYENLQIFQISGCFIEHNNYMYFIKRHTEDKYLIWTCEPTSNNSVTKLMLVIKIVNSNGQIHKIMQPITNHTLSCEEAKAKVINCLLRSKVKGFQFQVAVEDMNVNVENATSVHISPKDLMIPGGQQNIF